MNQALNFRKADNPQCQCAARSEPSEGWKSVLSAYSLRHPSPSSRKELTLCDTLILYGRSEW